MLLAALKAARMAVFEWDLPSGQVSYLENSPAVCGYPVGYREQDGWAAMHPEDMRSLREIVADAIATRTDYRAQFRFTRADTGAVRWMEMHGSISNRNSSAATQITGVLLDMTEQREAECALRQSEERFRAFVTASSNVVYRMSADWSEMRHLEGGDFIADTEDPSRAWLDKYIYADDQPRVMEAIREAIRTKSTFELEHRVVRTDGSLGWTFSRAIPLFDPSGEIAEWFGTATDLTERKRAEEALTRLAARSESERRLYETVLSNTPDLVYVFDLHHRFSYANKALLRMWGKTWSEAIGKNCLELGYEPWHAAMHDREIEQVIATKRSIRGEVPFTGTNGRRIYEYIFVPVIGKNGEVEAIAGTTRDVTDRKLAEEELRLANEDLEQFAYSASHDLQEPLRGISIYSELLTKRYEHELEGSALEFLSHLKDGAKRMEMLVRDLLAYTQVMRLDSSSDTADSDGVLKSALANLREAITESEAQVTFDPLPRVRIKPIHLQQLFQNLIGNALKYRSPARLPAIHISAERQDGLWLFSVTDNGIGIDPAYKDHIFGVFKRLHTNREYSGTGIGLAICQRIVERYGGRISVESRVGEGSRFRFSLPE